MLGLSILFDVKNHDDPAVAVPPRDIEKLKRDVLANSAIDIRTEISGHREFRISSEILNNNKLILYMNCVMAGDPVANLQDIFPFLKMWLHLKTVLTPEKAEQALVQLVIDEQAVRIDTISKMRKKIMNQADKFRGELDEQLADLDKTVRESQVRFEANLQLVRAK